MDSELTSSLAPSVVDSTLTQAGALARVVRPRWPLGLKGLQISLIVPSDEFQIEKENHCDDKLRFYSSIMAFSWVL
jgi:hypothetical protein